MSFLFRLFSSAPKITMADARTKVQQYIDSSPVVVFSKTYCPYCASTKSLLKSFGAKTTILELDQEADGSAMQDALQEISGQRTVPNIFIAQKHIGGNSELQSLDKAGKLQGLLKDAGAL
ncbi:Glutaredoxin-like protein [Hapsidospora chrysogenum ATCC 11550]|uniref:Glutaredoxin-like protein n=1 Tax=Hapsidospora chrysogenum (strain ATCC 11550 / CBS 779.69 / DSM 880 / IAM 14645 / JCM 23072 / IMI 49137) TaxID=857340 RepID=A0A086SZG2_HAPC1|nr:Glutaredoxin-like protein [Hapsidospora chrysogenum ATCC 11550]